MILNQYLPVHCTITSCHISRKLILALASVLIFKKWSANLDGNYVSSAFADGSNMGSINPGSARFGRIDSRIVLDGAMGYEYSKKVRIFANIRNIGNTACIVSRQPEGARPGAPITVMGGLEFSL